MADRPRDRLPVVAVAGKSNVGKSSVINRLLLRKNFARVGEAPGKTIHINYFRIDGQLYLTDLPGYGYAKVSASEKERWSRLMESFFASPDSYTKGVLVVDARHEPTENDLMMADCFQKSGRPFAVAANKFDKLKKSEQEPNLVRIREALHLTSDTPLIAFSAETGLGRDKLLAFVTG